MKTKWIVLCISIILIGFLITIAGKQLITPHELTTKEISERIEQVYNAKIQTIVEKDDSFLASFNKNGSIFEVNIHAVTGQLSNLTLVHKKIEPPAKAEQKDTTTEESSKTEQPKTDTKTEQPENEPKTERPKTTAPNTGKVETQQPKPVKPLLTEQQAIAIALKEVPGELDSVEFKSSADGGSYFVEIEQEDEVTVQIHAITGKILSIQYDD